jgi:hypothetical protein
MMRFWDRYGVWVVVYVYVLSRLFDSSNDWGGEGGLLWRAFLMFNLMISAGVGYRALLRAVPAFGTWAPLALRWIARFMLYAFLWCIPVGMFFSLLQIWDMPPHLLTALALSGACVTRHVQYDVRKLNRASFIG